MSFLWQFFIKRECLNLHCASQWKYFYSYKFDLYFRIATFRGRLQNNNFVFIIIIL